MPWGSMGTIWAEIGLNYAGLTRGMQEATRQIEAFDRDVNARFRAIGESFSQVGRSLSLGVTAPLAALGGIAAKAFMDFETSMANVWTLLDVGRDKIQAMSQEVEALSLRVPQSAKQLADGLYQVISASVPAEKAMYVLEVAAKAASAGLADTYTSVDAITTVLNAYQISADQAGRVSDIMFKTVERGKITYQEMAATMGQVISTAAEAGVAFEEVAGAYAMLTRNGVQAEQAATGIAYAIRSIVAPTESALKAAEAYGVQLGEQALASKGFVGVLQDIYQATGGSQEALAKLMGSIEGARAVTVLARDAAQEYIRDIQSMADAAGAAERAFEKQARTSAAQFQIFKNEVAALARSFGSELLPVLNAGIEAVKPIIEAFTNLPGPVKEAAIAFGIYAASIGPVLSGLGALIGFLTGPAGLALAIGAVVAAIAGWVRTSRDLDGAIDRQVSSARRAIDEAMRQADTYGRQAEELDRLIKEYEELQGKPDKSQQEHERLRQVIDAIVQLAPQAVTGYDDMGRALIGNADAAKRVRDELWQLRKEQLELAAMRARYELPGLEEQVRLLEPQFNKVKAQLDEIAPRYYKMREVVLAMSQATSDAQREQILQAAIAKGIFDAFSPPATQFAATEQSYNKLYSTLAELSSALLKAKTGILELKNAEKQLEEWLAGKPAVTTVPSTSGTGTSSTARTPTGKATADELSEFEKFNAEVQKLSSESYGVLKRAWAEVAKGLKSSDVVERALAEERASKLLGILKDKLAEYGGEFPKSAEEFSKLFERAASAMSMYIKAGWQELEQASDMEAFTKWSGKVKALSSDAFGVLQEAWADIERGLKAEDPAVRAWAELRARDLAGVIEAALGQFGGDWLKAAAAASAEVKSGYQRIKEKADEGQSELAKAMATLRYRVSVEGLGIEEQVKELEAIQQTDAYRRASVEEQRQLEMQLAGLREELRQKNVRDAYEEYQFYAELYDYDAQNHIDHLNRLLQDARLNADERKKLSQELALWEKKQKDEEAAYKKKVEDAWNAYYLASGKKTKADLLREELKKREAELEAARKTGKGIELAEAAVAQARLDLNKQLRQDEEDRFRFMVAMGALSTEEQLKQIQTWIDAEEEGNARQRALMIEARSLRIKLFEEQAEAAVQATEDLSRFSLQELQGLQDEYAAAYDAMLALGDEGANAARIYKQALKAVASEIARVTKEQEDLNIAIERRKYKRGEITPEEYIQYLTGVQAAAKQYSAAWFAVDDEIEQVRKDQEQRAKESADKAAESQIANAEELARTNLRAAVESLMRWRDTASGMGKAYEDAVAKVDAKLKEFAAREKQVADEINAYLADRNKSAFQKELERLDQERKANEAAAGDKADVHAWYLGQVTDKTKEAVAELTRNLDHMTTEEVMAARATLDEMLALVEARVGAESEAANEIAGAYIALNNRLEALDRERAEKLRAETKKNVQAVVSELDKELAARRTIGAITWQEEMHYLATIASLDADTQEARWQRAAEYYSRVTTLMESLKAAELEAMRAVLTNALETFSQMEQGGEEMVAAIIALLDLLDEKLTAKTESWAEQIGWSFAESLGELGSLIAAFRKGMESSGGDPIAAAMQVWLELVKQSKTFAALLNVINPLIQALADMVGAVLEPLIPLVQVLSKILIPVFQAVGKVFAWVADVVVSVWNAIANVVNWALGWLGVHIPTISPTWREEVGLTEPEEPESGVGKQGTQISEITGPTRDLLIETLRPLTVLDSLPVYAMAIEKAIYEMRDAFLAFVGVKAAAEAGAAAVVNEYHISTINIYAQGKEDFDALMASLSRRAELAALGSGA